MSFAPTWMDLEIITLSEASQRKTDIIFLYVESKKNYTNKLIYKTHRLKERIYGYGDWGER